MNLEQAAKLSHEQWREMAAELKTTANARLFIGGEFVDAVDGGTFDNINPVDGTLINKCAAGQAADIDKAVKIASKWGQSTLSCAAVLATQEKYSDPIFKSTLTPNYYHSMLIRRCPVKVAPKPSTTRT
jgi:hypothetical protein